jgi:hypothetical protein
MTWYFYKKVYRELPEDEARKNPSKVPKPKQSQKEKRRKLAQ